MTNQSAEESLRLAYAQLAAAAEGLGRALSALAAALDLPEEEDES